MRPTARAALVLVATLGAIVLVVLGLGWLLTHPLASSVGRLDDDLARWIAAHRTPGLGRAADVATYAGETRVGFRSSSASASWSPRSSTRGDRCCSPSW